ncbi:hypothetical protein GIB67_006064 [Kingdonia uniflora]|uniref:procollagen-proline 3-dioxygenase n=1 Tax=Kingdonia uniflora TaxID=39325 RepID=A0A7J7LPV7_9MAGN|nr:hypothetical protein GIB67_006064 [Kingdonia uniflora]
MERVSGIPSPPAGNAGDALNFEVQTNTHQNFKKTENEMDESGDHPRLILHDFLPLSTCKELEFIHKSCSTVGYRPKVFSTTLSHLIATNSAHLIIPFVSIRERLRDKAEEFFGCEYELFVEFTGLISWSKGASIGWHSDDNRSYLKQRHFAAVCYLNNHGEDFEGGLFQFQDGKPATIAPMAGDVLMYSADSRNIHSVDEITDGERLTLTLWFSRDKSYDEDAKLINLLSQNLSTTLYDESASYLPLPAPSNMYWFVTEEDSGFDIRWARIHILGFTFCLLDYKKYDFILDPSCDFSEQLVKPLWLARVDEILDTEFVNCLHALQVVQFYWWKASELQTGNIATEAKNIIRLSVSLLENNNRLEEKLLGDHQLSEAVFHNVSRHKNVQCSFVWDDFSAAIAAWKDYTLRLRVELFASLANWRKHQSVFSLTSMDIH